MADDNNSRPELGVARPQLETSISGDRVTSVEPGDPDAKPTTKTASGVSAEIGRDDTTVRTSNQQDEPGEGDAELSDDEREELAEGADGEGTDEGETDKKDGNAETEELPDYDPDKPESVEAYEKAYTLDGGGLNYDRLDAEFNRNTSYNLDTGELTGGGLTEGQYKFLEAKGYPRKLVDEHIANKTLAFKVQMNEMLERAGGKDQYKAMTAWARDGGYTPEQAKRFNDALNAGGQERNDQIDLLKQRFAAAKGEKPQRKLSPDKSTHRVGTGGGDGPAPGTYFETREAYREALREASRAKDGRGDAKALAEVRAKLARSPWAPGKRR